MGRVLQGGDIFEWDGNEFNKVCGGPHERFSFNGSDFRPSDGDQAWSFSWNGSCMRPWDTNMKKSFEIRGGDFYPCQGDSGLGFRKVGSGTLLANSGGGNWTLEGDVPDAVLCGWIAAYLNRARFESSGDDDSDGSPGSVGSDDGGGDVLFSMPYVTRPVQPVVRRATPPPTSKVSVPLICEVHEVSHFERCPNVEQCHSCEDEMLMCEPAYRCQSCPHTRYYCEQCVNVLRASKDTHKAHPHPMLTIKSRMDRHAILGRHTACSVCESKDSGEGAWCDKCSVWICRRCCRRPAPAKSDPCDCTVC